MKPPPLPCPQMRAVVIGPDVRPASTVTACAACAPPDRSVTRTDVADTYLTDAYARPFERGTVTAVKYPPPGLRRRTNTSLSVHDRRTRALPAYTSRYIVPGCDAPLVCVIADNSTPPRPAIVYPPPCNVYDASASAAATPQLARSQYGYPPASRRFDVSA